MADPTSYQWRIECADLGEYDGVLLAKVSALIAEALGEAGVVGFVLWSNRCRSDEVG